MSSTVEPHAQIPKCVDGIGDGIGIVKSDRSLVVVHHFGLVGIIGFQAAVSDTSGGKHPESSHQLIVRSRCLRRIVRQTEVSGICQVSYHFISVLETS